MIKPALVICGLCLLCACDPPPPEVRVSQNVHDGSQSVRARPMLFHFDPTTTVMAYPAYEHRQGETLWSIELSISRDDLNYPKIDEVWSYGRKLTYRKIDRRRRFCEPVCRREERGQIILSQTGFAQAAETGLAFEIQGRRGTYDGSIQAFHFQRVLAQLRQN